MRSILIQGACPWAITVLGVSTAVLTLAAMGALTAAAAKNNDEPPPRIPLSVNLRFVIRPTLLGLVPPDDPEGYGELFVRVTALGAGGGTLQAHYELKEQIEQVVETAAPPPPEESERPKPRLTSPIPDRRRRKPEPSLPPPVVETKSVTRIRRGEITALRLDSARYIESPLMWGDGDWRTDSGLLWLSTETFRALKTEAQAPWDAAGGGGPDDAARSALTAAVAKHAEQLGLAADAPCHLRLTGRAEYPCVVNGERTRVPALRCADSLGVAEYWVLDDEENPLVLEATYLGLEPAIAAASGFAITEIDFS